MAAEGTASGPGEAGRVRYFFEKTPTEEFVSAWAQNLAAFAATPRIAESGMQKNYDFLREGEGKAVVASFTNEVVDTVAPSMG